MSERRLDQIRPGDCLDGAIPDGEGGVLIPAGTVLTAAMLDQLRSLGIQTVHIAGEMPGHGAQEHDVTARLRHLFRRAGEGPASQALFRQLAAHRMAEKT